MAISLIAALSSTPVLAHSLTVMPRSQTQVATLSAEIVLTVFLFCPKATQPPPPHCCQLVAIKQCILFHELLCRAGIGAHFFVLLDEIYQPKGDKQIHS